MKHLFFIIPLFVLSLNTKGQSKKEIIEVLSAQEKLWNDGNITGFMEYYWKSEELKFIGSKGITKGWQATLDRYLKTYPDRQTMGQLTFEIKNIDFHSKKVAWVLGQWNLKRPEKGDVGGYFTLILQKINGKWLITTDHTS
jgi:ketosteroid isomerase-like protein